MLGNRSVRVIQSCWWSNSALMDEAREASWRENIPAGNRSAGLLDGFEFKRKLKLRCLSPQKLFGSHESSSVQLWVSYNRQPMKAARFMTRHPITVSPITKCWCQGMLRVGTSWTFFFFFDTEGHFVKHQAAAVWMNCWRRLIILLLLTLRCMCIIHGLRAIVRD